MVETTSDPTLSLLKTIFPNFVEGLCQLYHKDPVFRDIATEYKECRDKQEAIFKETGRSSELFDETMNELKEELITYLTSIP